MSGKKVLDQYESDEERYFAAWLDELVAAGFVDSYLVHPFSYEITEKLINKYNQVVKLKTKTRIEQKEQVLLTGSVYTPDFMILWNDSAYKIFYDLLGCGTKIDAPFIAHLDSSPEGGEQEDFVYSIVETKGSFDYQNMTRVFINNQKIVWDKYERYVNLCKVPDIFEQTFTPSSYLKTPTGLKRKITKFKPLSLKQFLKR